MGQVIHSARGPICFPPNFRVCCFQDPTSCYFNLLTFFVCMCRRLRAGQRHDTARTHWQEIWRRNSRKAAPAPARTRKSIWRRWRRWRWRRVAGDSVGFSATFHLISKVFRPEFEARPAPADRAPDRTGPQSHSIAPHSAAFGSLPLWRVTE